LFIIIPLGSGKLTGGAPGLQIRCDGEELSGGFDSHALPPIFYKELK
jgi:hypothetical protein